RRHAPAVTATTIVATIARARTGPCSRVPTGGRRARSAPTVRVNHKKLATYIRDDVNIVAAGLLYDMAILQSSERSAFGYKRAGKVIATHLDRSLRDLVAAGTVREVPYLGRASERLIEEVVATGQSETVTAAV